MSPIAFLVFIIFTWLVITQNPISRTFGRFPLWARLTLLLSFAALLAWGQARGALQ